MENVRCEGSNICYSDQGKGDVIVLLHGFCGSAEYWEKVIPGLTAHYRVIAPDLRGHGASDAPLGAYTIEQMADDVLSLLNALEIQECYLLGHSLGGYITLSFAQRHASRLKGFGLIHSSGYPDSEEAKENRLKSVTMIQSEGILLLWISWCLDCLLLERSPGCWNGPRRSATRLRRKARLARPWRCVSARTAEM